MRGAVLLFVAACGRLGFDQGSLRDAPVEARVDAPGVARPVLVQSPAGMGSGASMAVPLTPTRGNSLVVVATMNYNPGGVAPLTTSVVDDAGTTYVSANSRATWSGPQGEVEIWYAANVVAGATVVTIASAATTTRSAWILELANMDPSGPLDVVNTISDGASNMMPIAPAVTPTRTPTVIVSAILISGFVTGVSTGNPFVPLPTLDGDAVAYLITDQPGTYAAAWDAPASDNFGSCTAAFRGLAAD